MSSVAARSTCVSPSKSARRSVSGSARTSASVIGHEVVDLRDERTERAETAKSLQSCGPDRGQQRANRLDEGLERRVEILVAAAVQDDAAALVGAPCDLRREM